MDQSPADGAALLRRTLRRTLIVLGGSVAGTAIAVAITSASASADPRCPAAQPAAPGPVEPVVAGQPLAVRLIQPACALQAIVPVLRLTDLGAGPSPAVGALDDNLADNLGENLGDDLGAGLADPIGLAPRVLVDLGGRDQGGLGGAVPAGVPTESTLRASSAGQPAAATPATSGPGAPADAPADLIRPGSPAPGLPAPWVFPHLPPLPVAQPAAPSGGPASSGSGHAGGGGDSPAFALPVSAGRTGLMRVPAPPATEPRLHAVPGRAPGATPD